MSIFDTNSTGEFTAPGGELEPIPAKTNCLVVAEAATIIAMGEKSSNPGESYINIKWIVLQPGLYARRILFQKVRVNHPDPEKRKTALNMLAAIDCNSKAPDDRKLKHLNFIDDIDDIALARVIVNSKMVAMVQVIKPKNGEQGYSGNWINKISPYVDGTVMPGPTPGKSPVGDLDDDIPF